MIEIGYSRGLLSSDLEYLRARQQRDQWEVCVHPVPSSHRARLRAALTTLAIPRIREWLEQTRALAARQGRGFCRVLYHEGHEKVLLEQRLNDFDDPKVEELAALKMPDSNEMQQTKFAQVRNCGPRG